MSFVTESMEPRFYLLQRSILIQCKRFKQQQCRKTADL